jgi:broad specificity phosphatase PhoE
MHLSLSLSFTSCSSCDGMTYEEIAETHPDEFQARAQNKLTYRYPMGESYVDVIRRLEPVIFELERSRDPVLVVGHRVRVLVFQCVGRCYSVVHVPSVCVCVCVCVYRKWWPVCA